MHIRRGWLLGKTLKHSVLIGVQWAVLSTEPRPRSKIFSKFGFTSPPGFTGYSIQWPLLNALCHYYVLNKQFSEFQIFTFWGDWEVEEMNMNITVNDPSTLSFLTAGFVAWGGHISCWQKLTEAPIRTEIFVSMIDFKEHYLIQWCSSCESLLLYQSKNNTKLYIICLNCDFLTVVT